MTDYSTSLDMWSFGCIFIEILLRYKLFEGKNAKELAIFFLYGLFKTFLSYKILLN
jgi:serine/threonine protein kinase